MSIRHKPGVRKRVREKLHQPLAVRIRRTTIRTAMILIGAAMAALGFVLFQIPYNITAGGLSGLAIIINEYVGISQGIFIWLCNIPLLVLGYFYLGKWKFVRSSIIAVIAFSGFIELFVNFMPSHIDPYPITDDRLLACIYAGVLFGVGMGLIYRAGSTVGGTSIPAAILHKLTGYPMSQVYLFTDLGVICLGGFTFSWEMAMLALLTLVLSGMFSDFTLEGSSQLRTAIIITSKSDQMRYAIINEMRRGVSMWDVTGGYNKESRTMLYCTVMRSRIHDLRYMVSQIDPNAVIVVGVVQQAWGGYGNLKLKAD